jgi:pimeloyl-ACP methyl ester carboxylesterase
MNKSVCLVLLLAFTTTLFAQEKQGNIVQYFGKEKVESIDEGSVIHVFKEGLITGQDRFGLNSNTTPKEPIISEYLLNSQYKITEGQPSGLDGNSGDHKWEAIKVNEKNEFADRKLSSGYLYTEYNASAEKIVLLETSGPSLMFVNGMPHESDHYDFGYSVVPIKLKKGKNEFLFIAGRFSRIRARLLNPKSEVMLTLRDQTTPDVLRDEENELWGAIRVLNANDSWFTGGTIVCKGQSRELKTPVPKVAPMLARKIKYSIPWFSTDEKSETLTLTLLDKGGKKISSEEITIGVRSKGKHHKRTFISDIDGSVQYYSVAPPTTDTLSNPAMFLSVHGASVEAVNQANAYKQKDWGYLIAPTNRRPYGFAWEDWGRLDALEVLNDAETKFQTDPKHTYLTGHSMGGHGTWYLGATYPDRFAAIGPAAGYPDLLGYRDSFRKRLKIMTDEDLAQWGITRERANEMMKVKMYEEDFNIAMDSIIRRAGNPSRTLKLKRNYLHHGVYILHGEKDNVVPTFIAQDMRALLGTYHNDFAYFEYPNGTHWYGNHSVDWDPLFDFFHFREIKPSEEIAEIEFYTGSPGVSEGSHFIDIIQQEIPFEISSFNFDRERTNRITTDNVKVLSIDLKNMGSPDTLIIDTQLFNVSRKGKFFVKKTGEKWEESSVPSLAEKGPHRNGGFKDAFRNNFLLVYATKGSKEENEWYYGRALLDAETFYYRANGNVEIMSDGDFDAQKHRDNNVILYGNRDNNSAWSQLLPNCPLQVSDGELKFGNKSMKGENLGAYFIYRKENSNVASVGVVTATSMRGAKAAYANHYLLNGTTFPDVLIFNDKVLQDGISAVQVSGFFGNDWSVDSGDFVIRE